MRTDVTFAIQQFGMSERQACKLVNLDRSSYRYEPAPDHNAQLREELVSLAKQKPRYGYRRLHALLTRRGHHSSPQRLYRVYKSEGLAVRRLKRTAHSARSTTAVFASSQSRIGARFCIGCISNRSRCSCVGDSRRLHARMFDFRGRYESLEPASDSFARTDH
jgi:putative transposase